MEIQGIGVSVRRICGAMLVGIGVAGCVPMAQPLGQELPASSPEVADRQQARHAAWNFLDVLDRVEPMAEKLCRDVGESPNCDYQILVDNRPGEPANAFQTEDVYGRPVIVFTLALIADAHNPDELAFVMGHEAAHHIAGHLVKQVKMAEAAAAQARQEAEALGYSRLDVAQAEQEAAVRGALAYAKEYEFQADAIGARIAYAAGFDPVLGAAYFDRLPDLTDQFQTDHPSNASRKQAVVRLVAQLPPR